MGNCKKCPFYKTEPVPEDLVGKVNLTEWSSCDVDAVGLAAADRIANQSTHIAALQQEIEKLRGIKTVLWDERATSVTAANMLTESGTFGKKRKEVLDAVAATVILESYLAWRKNHKDEI